jgi:RNA polymerase sigma-70 factor (ECF subfamily)
METLQVQSHSVGAGREEADWVLRTQNGECAAFGRLVERYQDRVFNTCLRIIGDRAAAEDLTQEAFMKAYASISGFDGRASFYTWLYRIAVNLCLSARRKPTRAPYSLDSGRAAPDGNEDCGEERHAALGPSPLEAASQQEQHRLVLDALAELDDEHRTVVVLRDIESLDYAQIAEILKVPPGTVKSRLHRARLALRERLRPMLGDT